MYLQFQMTEVSLEHVSYHVEQLSSRWQALRQYTITYLVKLLLFWAVCTVTYSLYEFVKSTCTHICKEVSASAIFNRCCKNTHFFFSYTKIVVKGMTRAEHILKVMYKLIAEMLIAQSQLI